MSLPPPGGRDQSGPYGPLCKNRTRTQPCHAERSEASRGPSSQTLRCAQGDSKREQQRDRLHHRYTQVGVTME
jgi:hypothetical protein